MTDPRTYVASDLPIGYPNETGKTGHPVTMHMYEVMAIRHGKLASLARFRALADALRFVQRNGRRQSLAIRTPAGRWYQDPLTGNSILGRRVVHPQQ